VFIYMQAYMHTYDTWHDTSKYKYTQTLVLCPFNNELSTKMSSNCENEPSKQKDERIMTQI